MSGAKRRRGVPLYVWVSQDELDTIHQRMEDAGTQNLGAYIRKMALNGYVLNVDLSQGTATRALRSLTEKGFINVLGQGKNTRYVQTRFVKPLTGLGK